MKKNAVYNIGLDIGTNSVGYAVTDENGSLVKFKGKNMWGVRLFEEGKSAKETRLYRCSRRRYDRRKNRISLLQQMLSNNIQQIDDAFFIRLKQSSLWLEDRERPDFYSLFNDKNFNEKEYYRKFPTIYHLRKFLFESNEKADIRLIYLALHHIIKYRGNFLYEDQNISAQNSDIIPAVNEFLNALCALADIKFTNVSEEKIADILLNESIKKSDKVNAIISHFNPDKEDKAYFKQVANALIGYKADFKLIFDLNIEENLKYSLSSDDADIKLQDLLDDSQSALYNAMQKVYSAYLLNDLLMGDNIKCLSDAMVNKYNRHSDDLKILKQLFKTYFPGDYNFMFRGKKNADNNYIKDKSKKNYTSYILGEQCCSKEELYKSILRITDKKKNEIQNDSNYKYVIESIEKETFLSKINSKSNGAIPYQLHLEELVKIIENQAAFYPSLSENKSKLCCLVTFRIPYYIGPLNEKVNPKGDKQRQFSWMIRKIDNQKIYPWNFEEVVDLLASAEKFITRMTNKCTYLNKEDVIPKNSLLYSEYEVLNEIKQIKANNRFLPFEIKKALFEELFKTQKSISENTLKRWLVNEKKYPKDIKLTGFQKEDMFASSLSSYIDFKNIFGKIDKSNIEMIETLILWITLYEDKKILKLRIKNQMPNLTPTQTEKICKLKYSGWSRLSRKLLEGIAVIDKSGRRVTIIDAMRNTNKNFMQIITDDELGFNKIIRETAKPKQLDDVNSFIDELAGSPAIKRGIKQSYEITKELVDIMKAAPGNIYIEFAREDGKKIRTQSRYGKLTSVYDKLKDNHEYQKIIEELKNINKKDVDDRMLFLYFIQNGKSLYSGKPLNIATLSQTCQIDHIIPQSYIKDDSFDNLALVLSGENQNKSDNMLIDPNVIDKQKSMWLSLLKNGLISQKKYENLIRKQDFTEQELKGFINRQLVETRQIIKHTANMFGALYSDTNIIEIKSELISNIRDQNRLYKIRQINDYHHAHDAYLAAAAGRYISICYPNLKDEFDYFAYKRFVKNNNRMNNGYFAGSFSLNRYDKKTGEVLWNGESETKKIRNCLNYKDCFISKKVEEQTGIFYKQTLYEKNANENSKLIPVKAHLPVCKYGGFIEPVQAYFAVIKYDKKNKQEKKLVGIPLYIVKLSETKPNAVYDYLESSGFKNPKILKDRIMKYQKILYEDNEYYLSSSNEVHNARQLILNSECNRIIYMMNHEKYKKEIDDKDLISVYEAICGKIERFYPCYKNILNKLINAKEQFVIKDNKEKIGIINELLLTLQANPTNGNFAKYNIGALVDREGRMSGKNLNIDKIIFINTSITGLYENRIFGKELSDELPYGSYNKAMQVQL